MRACTVYPICAPSGLFRKESSHCRSHWPTNLMLFFQNAATSFVTHVGLMNVFIARHSLSDGGVPLYGRPVHGLPETRHRPAVRRLPRRVLGSARDWAVWARRVEVR